MGRTSLYRNKHSEPSAFPKEPLIRCCLADAVCRLSTAAPLKARSDKLTKVNFSKWLCHQTFIALLLSWGKLQWSSACNCVSGLRETTGVLSCNSSHHFIEAQKSKRYHYRPTWDSMRCSEFGGIINIKPLTWLSFIYSCNIFSDIQIISVTVLKVMGCYLWEVMGSESWFVLPFVVLPFFKETKKSSLMVVRNAMQGTFSFILSSLTLYLYFHLLSWWNLKSESIWWIWISSLRTHPFPSSDKLSSPTSWVEQDQELLRRDGLGCDLSSSNCPRT